MNQCRSNTVFRICILDNDVHSSVSSCMNDCNVLCILRYCMCHCSRLGYVMLWLCCSIYNEYIECTFCVLRKFCRGDKALMSISCRNLVCNWSIYNDIARSVQRKILILICCWCLLYCNRWCLVQMCFCPYTQRIRLSAVCFLNWILYPNHRISISTSFSYTIHQLQRCTCCISYSESQFERSLRNICCKSDESILNTERVYRCCSVDICICCCSIRTNVKWKRRCTYLFKVCRC